MIFDEFFCELSADVNFSKKWMLHNVLNQLWEGQRMVFSHLWEGKRMIINTISQVLRCIRNYNI